MRSAAHIFPVRLVRNRRRLPLATDASLRIAQISLPGVLFEKASYLLLDDSKALAAFGPQALIGSSAQLLRLARQVRSGETVLPDLDCAVFVITDFRDAPLGNDERTRLWNAFSVPIYELALSDDGTLLASECEAQEGWHIEHGVRFSLVNDQLWYNHRGRQIGTGLTGEIEKEPCPCGRPGQRIVNASVDFRDPVRQKLARIA